MLSSTYFCIFFLINSDKTNAVKDDDNHNDDSEDHDDNDSDDCDDSDHDNKQR